MRKSIFIITLLLSGLIACSDGVKKAQIYDEENKLVAEYFYHGDSVKHGLFKSFDQEGKVFEESSYVEGQLDGIRKIFYPNGNVEIEENYVLGQLQGDYKTFYTGGQQNLIAQFQGGVMQGLSKRFYESGGIMEEVNIENNEENGPFKEYYENGQVKWEGNYLNGNNEFGLLINYNESGDIIKKMQCDSNAVCQTIWTPEEGDIPLKKVFE